MSYANGIANFSKTIDQLPKLLFVLNFEGDNCDSIYHLTNEERFLLNEVVQARRAFFISFF